MRTLHGIFDVNNDGVISFDDFKLLAQNFGDLGHLSNDEMQEFLSVLRVSVSSSFSSWKSWHNSDSNLPLILGHMGDKLRRDRSIQLGLGGAIFG